MRAKFIIVLVIVVVVGLILFAKPYYTQVKHVEHGRLVQRARILVSIADAFFAVQGRYPTNLEDIVINFDGEGRKWASNELASQFGYAYLMLPGADGYEVHVSRKGSLLLPAVTVTNKIARD